jgi:hypothetical protein
MGSMGRVALALVLSLAGAVGARAQTPYVAATIGADVARVSHSTSTLSPTASGDSEALSWSLRAGTSVGESWGVELEFVTSGRSRVDIPVGISPLIPGTVTTVGRTDLVLPPNLPFPIGGFQTDVRRMHADLDTVAWVRQRAGGIDLVYLGGIAFSRQRLEITQTFPTLFALFAPGGGTFRTTAINYGTRPLVGAEARIGLTSRVRLIPGIRLQGLADGWLVRPYAGLGWSF